MAKTVLKKGSANAAKKSISGLRKLKGLSNLENKQQSMRSVDRLSKFVALGDTLRIFSLVYRDPETGELEFPTATTILSQMYTEKDRSKSVRVELSETNGSILQPYIRIANTFHHARFEKELEAALTAKRAEAEDLGEEFTESMEKDIIEKIKVKFFGKKADEGKDNGEFAEVNPAITRWRASGLIPAVAIKITTKDSAGTVEKVPNSRVGRITLKVTEKLKTQLRNAINDVAQFSTDEFHLMPGWDDLYWVEFEYKYSGTSKKEAGKNASMAGVATKMSIKETTPDLFQKSILPELERISLEEDVILANDNEFKYAISEANAITQLHDYFKSNAAVLMKLPDDDEKLVKTAGLILDTIDLKSKVKLHDKLQRIAAENKEDEEDEVSKSEYEYSDDEPTEDSSDYAPEIDNSLPEIETDSDDLDDLDTI